MNIPPPGTNYRGTGKTFGDSKELVGRLKALGLGESIEITRSEEATIGWRAKALGIKIARRRLGSADSTTIYRIE